MGIQLDGKSSGDEQSSLVLELPVTDATFDLEKAVCSHGLFMMAPNRWDPSTKSLHRPLRLSSPSHSVSVRISHPSPPKPLLVSVFGVASLSSQDQQCLLAQVRRMLRISEENDRAVREFQEMHVPSVERGFGRVFRSPDLFEDMVKCILMCNCQWSRTLSMARALCELQSELMGCSVTEDHQPKTPEVKKEKRKLGKEKKVAVKFKTEFVKNNIVCAEEEKSVVNHASQTQSPRCCQLSNTASCLGELQNSSSVVNNCSIQIGNFPSPGELVTLDVNFLAQKCKLGYRSQRILSLAKAIVDEKIELQKLEEICNGFSLGSYDVLDLELSGICGFGPFTRANVLMCMGFYHKIPTDSETIRHLKQFHGRSNCTSQTVMYDLEKIYGAYAPYQFLAYWSELWNDYQERFGKLSEMPPSDYQVITANNMKRRKTCKKL
ncbi:hypothetical protein J5N97_013014 [Dioscorea zingiberensis]|uniref:HhH-GPD domain-containing protein n=1 Tax=Dioscorea zingiberensis TaxID=325984 RepID=A0A9D5CQ09_9LILI|nr:hypothetical protein J5N97_013014 [Dioscorea zingiberensis]